MWHREVKQIVYWLKKVFLFLWHIELVYSLFILGYLHEALPSET